MENYTRIIGSTSTNIRTPTAGEINQGNDTLTPFDSAKNNGYSNEMSKQLGDVSTELTSLISAAGLTPDATLGQVLEAITNLQNLGDAAGAVNVYTSLFATNPNTRYLIKINITNTGASTLNGTAMQKFSGVGTLVPLAAGDLVANQEYDILDNGSSIVVLNPEIPSRTVGATVQVVNIQDGAVATGTTIMAADDTIPQNTEGDEYMTLAITPTNSSNKLKIEVVAQFSHTTASNRHLTALFQDSTAGALAAILSPSNASASATTLVTFTHYMTAGTTSSTTFKIRSGATGVGTTTFNGTSGVRVFGGVMASSITITEIQV